MENTPQDPAHLRREFQPCRNRFTAFGGKTRQDLLRALLSPPPAGSAGDRCDKSPKRGDSRLLLSGPAGQWDRKRSAPVRRHSADPEKRSGQERRGLTAAITGGIQLWICSRPWSTGMRSAPPRTGPSRRRRDKNCWRASPSATGRAGFTSSLFWMSPGDSEGFRPTTGSSPA